MRKIYDYCCRKCYHMWRSIYKAKRCPKCYSTDLDEQTDLQWED